jgi:hypothetical protein
MCTERFQELAERLRLRTPTMYGQCTSKDRTVNEKLIRKFVAQTDPSAFLERLKNIRKYFGVASLSSCQNFEQAPSQFAGVLTTQPQRGSESLCKYYI